MLDIRFELGGRGSVGVRDVANRRTERTEWPEWIEWLDEGRVGGATASMVRAAATIVWKWWIQG